MHAFCVDKHGVVLSGVAYFCYTILIAVMFAPVRLTAFPAALWIDNEVLSAVALYRMVFDTFAALFADVLPVMVSPAMPEPFSYSCTDISPFAVVVPVAPYVIR